MSDADIVSPISYPYPNSVIVTIVTAPPETIIVALAVSPSPLVVSGTFVYVPFVYPDPPVMLLHPSWNKLPSVRVLTYVHVRVPSDALPDVCVREELPDVPDAFARYTLLAT